MPGGLGRVGMYAANKLHRSIQGCGVQQTCPIHPKGIWEGEGVVYVNQGVGK